MTTTRTSPCGFSGQTLMWQCPSCHDWGSMVAENKSLITFGRATPLYPAAAIALLTVAVNFVVDWFLSRTSGLRDGQ